METNTCQKKNLVQNSVDIIALIFQTFLQNDLFDYGVHKGVTKKCRLSWLTNSAVVYEPKCWGRGGVAGFSQ
jgi:hypothetical protein